MSKNTEQGTIQSKSDSQETKQKCIDVMTSVMGELPEKKKVSCQFQHSLQKQEMYNKWDEAVATIPGQMYKIKMCTLLFLKLINMGATFYLCSNLAEGGDFNDIVIHCSYKNENGEVENKDLFFQVKNVENKKTKRSVSFLEGYFDLHKYFLSYCRIQNTVDANHRILCSDPNNREYLIITNTSIDNESISGKCILSKVNKHNDLLTGLTLLSDVYNIQENECEEYLEFINIVEKINKMHSSMENENTEQILSRMIDMFNNKDNSVLQKFLSAAKKNNSEIKKIVGKDNIIRVNAFRDFISQTGIYSNQMCEDDLETFIKKEIEILISISAEETDNIYFKLLERLKFWWENDSYYLTENCELLFDIVRDIQASRFNQRENKLLTFGVEFTKETLQEIRSKLEENAGVLNVVCSGETTVMSSLKVLQAIRTSSHHNFILTDIKEYAEKEDILRKALMKGWCNMLIVEYINVSENTKHLVKTIVESLAKEQKYQVIFISPKTNTLGGYLSKTCHLVEYKEIFDTWSAEQLIESSWNKLYKKTVNFQGEVTQLSSIFIEDDVKRLESVALEHILINECLVIGKDITDSQIENYIPRYIEIPTVDGSLLSEKETKIILALEGCNDELNRYYPNGNFFTLEELEYSNIQRKEAICIIMENGKEKDTFHKLCAKFDNVHWLKNNAYQYLWKKSNAEIKVIEKFLNFSKVHLVEDKIFIEYHFKSPVIITGEPGMGKSTLLNYLALVLKQKYPSKWIVIVKLSDHCKYFCKLSKIDEESVIELLKSSLNLSQAELHFFTIASKNLENFIVLLDAFDEIGPHYTSKVSQMIKCLVDSSCLAYVSSRPAYVSYLKKEFCTHSFNIAPLSKELKEMYFLKLFRLSNEELNLKEAEERAKNLLQMYSNSLCDARYAFTENPLHLNMLAEIYSENAVQGTAKSKTVLNILEMYTEFVKLKCKIYFEKKKSVDMCNPKVKTEFDEFVKNFFEKNKLISVTAFFGEHEMRDSDLKYIKENIFNDKTQLENCFIKVGILNTVSEGRVNYIHRSFAEYFFALYMADNHKEYEKFFTHYFFQNYLKPVRCFFDLKCAEKCSVHTALLFTDSQNIIQNSIQSTEKVAEVDLLGRTVLHLAAAYNKVEILKQLTQHYEEIAALDNKGWTPMDYAIATNSFECLDVILGKKEEFCKENATLIESEDALEINKIKENLWSKIRRREGSVICLCCVKGLKHLLTLICENLNIRKYSFQKQIDRFSYDKEFPSIIGINLPLNVAAFCKQTDIVKLLLEFKCDINDKDHVGYTALQRACQSGCMDVIKILVENGCDVNYEIDFTKHIFIPQPVCGNYIMTLRSAKNNSEYFALKGQDYTGSTALTIASEHGHQNVVKYLINTLKDIHKDNIEISDSFLSASKKGHTNIVRYLIEECKVDINYSSSTGHHSLLLASKYGHYDTVKYLIHNGANINYADSSGETALLLSLREKKFDISKLLIDQGANINQANSSRDTPLLIASRKGIVDIVKCLVEKGADTQAADSSGNTALFETSWWGYVDVVKYLIDSGEDINSVNSSGDSTLLIALKWGSIDVVKYLLDKGANVNHVNNEGYTALLIASEKDHIEFVKYLLDHGVNIDHINKSGDTALMLASRRGNFEVVKYLTDHNANVNLINNKGNNALLLALHNEKLNVVKYLMNHKANANQINELGDNALLVSSEKGHLDIVKCLINAGLNINHVNNSGDSPLLNASRRGYIDIVKYLIDSGADVNCVNCKCETALLYASRRRFVDIIKFLVDHGANVNQVDASGNTALLLASEAGCSEIVQYLINNGANVNHFNNSGDTALLLALCKKKYDIVKYLIEKGVNVNHMNSSGDTALLLASKQGCTDFVEHLIKCGANVNHINNSSDTALFLSLKKYDTKIDIVMCLCKSGANVNYVNSLGNTVLFLAMDICSNEIVKNLIDFGADVNHSNEVGDTALLIASRKGSTDIVEYVINFGANVNHVNNLGDTALLLASCRGYTDIVKYLHDLGANVNHVNNSGDTALLLASHIAVPETVKYLIESGANVNYFNNLGSTALLNASRRGCIENVKNLIDFGANVNHVNNEGNTALLLASEQGYIDIVQYLLTFEANVNHFNNSGDTALIIVSGDSDHVKYLKERRVHKNYIYNLDDDAKLLSVEREKICMLECLINFGASIHHFNHSGDTALLVALTQGYTTVFKYLVDCGADINHSNNSGDTSLFIAVKNGYVDIVKYLVNIGANINHVNSSGDTALLLASDSDHNHIVENLVNFGADVNHVNNNGDTALLIAIRRDNIDHVRYLADHGAKINHVNNSGDTPLSLASKKFNKLIVNYLILQQSNE